MKLLWIFCGILLLGSVKSDRADQNSCVNYVSYYARWYKYTMETSINTYLYRILNRYRSCNAFLSNYIQYVSKVYAPSLANETAVQEFLASTYQKYENSMVLILPVFEKFYGNLSYINTYTTTLSDTRYKLFNRIRIKYNKNLDSCIYQNSANLCSKLLSSYWVMDNCYKVYAASSSSLASSLNTPFTQLESDVYSFSLKILYCTSSTSCVLSLVCIPSIGVSLHKILNLIISTRATENPTNCCGIYIIGYSLKAHNSS
jgi:hypothetical protein